MTVEPPPPATYTVIRSDDRHAVLVEEGSETEIRVEVIAYLPITTLQVRLRRGDRVDAVVWNGRVYGDVTRGPVPAHVAAAMADWLARLAELGLPLAKSSEALAREYWASNATTPHETLRHQVRYALVRVPLIHPDLEIDDLELGARMLTKAMRPHVPDFDLRVVLQSDEEGWFVLLPEAIEVPFGDYDYECPDEIWDPLVDAMNEQLAKADAATRWLPVKDWGLRLVQPELARLIEAEL